MWPGSCHDQWPQWFFLKELRERNLKSWTIAHGLLSINLRQQKSPHIKKLMYGRNLREIFSCFLYSSKHKGIVLMVRTRTFVANSNKKTAPSASRPLWRVGSMYSVGLPKTGQPHYVGPLESVDWMLTSPRGYPFRMCKALAMAVLARPNR